MSQALRQLDQGEESPVDKVAVLDYLSYAIYQQGEIEKALEITKRLLTLGESHARHRTLLKQRSEEEEEKEEKALRQSDEGKSESQTEDKPKKKKKAFKEPIPERKIRRLTLTQLYPPTYQPPNPFIPSY
ncbi:hypothetical protein CRUP_017934 [Coryphaenoides rupestris]|nr:hypothetical protein CRUP_017934 [Coryphaenoides rupestris]